MPQPASRAIVVLNSIWSATKKRSLPVMGFLAGIELGGMRFSEQGCAIGQEGESGRRCIALALLHGSVHNLYYSFLINLIELAGNPHGDESSDRAYS